MKPKIRVALDVSQRQKRSSFGCPAYISKRQDISDDDDVPLGMITKNLELVLVYAKDTI